MKFFRHTAAAAKIALTTFFLSSISIAANDAIPVSDPESTFTAT